jgi:tetratricopeptide (TPR) repeat protein
LTIVSQIDQFRTTIQETTLDKGIFSSNYKPIDIELLSDMRRFINNYASYPQTDEVLHLMALVHKRTKNYSAAALDWELLKVMYPQSTFVATANKQLQELSVDQLAKQVAMINRMNEQISMLSGDMDQRTGSFIEFLRSSRDEVFAPSIVAESASFLVRNETFQNEDIIESAIAHQSMLIDNDIALYRFNKLLSVYPASNLSADSMLSIAFIQREKLKLFDKASKTYLALIEKYPDSNEAKLGHEELATMYSVDMHDYPNAIRTYEEIIAKYKKDPSVLYSLLTLERIYESKTFQKDKAIDTYLRVADIYAQEQDGLSALIEAENIASNSPRSWIMAISINDRINARAPDSEEAIKALFSNADITENKLGDQVKAKEMYANFIADYPAHTLAKEAQKRISAMTKK